MAKFVRHHVGRVLGPAEAGLDEREARLHEDHQHGADDDPQQVDVLAEHGDRVGVLGVGDRRDQRDRANPQQTHADTKRTFAHEVLLVTVCRGARHGHAAGQAGRDHTNPALRPLRTCAFHRVTSWCGDDQCRASQLVRMRAASRQVGASHVRSLAPGWSQAAWRCSARSAATKYSIRHHSR